MICPYNPPKRRVSHEIDAAGYYSARRNIDKFKRPKKQTLARTGMDTFHSYFCEWWPNCCRICSFRENANIKLPNKYILKGSIPWVCCQDSPVSFKDFSKIIKSFSLRTTWHKRLEQLPQRSESLHKLDEKRQFQPLKTASKIKSLWSSDSSWLTRTYCLVFLQVNLHQLQSPWLLCSWGCLPGATVEQNNPSTLCTWSFVGERPWNSILVWICWTSCQMNSKTTCFSSLSHIHTWNENMYTIFGS